MSLQGGGCAAGLSLFSRCEIKTDGARKEHRVLEFALSSCAWSPQGTWSPLSQSFSVQMTFTHPGTDIHMHREKNNLEKCSGIHLCTIRVENTIHDYFLGKFSEKVGLLSRNVYF